MVQSLRIFCSSGVYPVIELIDTFSEPSENIETPVFLNENVRLADRVIRYGGDEFLVFMPETEQEAANLVADRLRDRILLVPRRTGIGDLDVGLSIGIYARKPGDTRSLESLLAEVDRRMYADKRSRHIDRADEYRS